MIGPDIDGEHCELNQVESLLNLDLSFFTIMNYSGLWDESDFPAKDKEYLLNKKLEDDKKWNNLIDFLKLINSLLQAIRTNTLSSDKIKNKQDWWNGYFDFPSSELNIDSFYQDLQIIKKFLVDAEQKGETKTAFYVE